MRRRLMFALAAAACGGSAEKAPPAADPAARAPAEEAPLRPAPGIDLNGPVTPPVRGVRKPTTAEALDLGADRAVVKVAVPAVGAGGSAQFTFGDDRRGWITAIPERNQLPSVAYGDGKVFVSGGFESVSFYSLDAETGKFTWQSRHLEDNGPTAPIYEDDKVIFNTESCTLFVMEAKTGKKLWYKYLGDPTLSQPAVKDGLIFAQHPGASNTGFVLSAYRVRDGHEVWARTVDGELLAAPVVDGDSVYVSTIGGRAYRFIRKSGKQVWSKQLQATSAPWVSEGELYLTRRAGDSEEQIVLEAATGKLVRSHRKVKAAYVSDVPRDMNDWKKVWAFEGSRPAIVDGTRYEAMGGTIQASDPRTGEAFWTRRHAAAEHKRSVSTVAVAGPQVVVATREGQLYGLDVDTGYTLWAYDIGRRVVAQPVVARGWVYATTADGIVIALQVGDTSLDGWHMWGGNPQHNGRVPAKPERS
jgi:outer membrane protein assembly factor BamB